MFPCSFIYQYTLFCKVTKKTCDVWKPLFLVFQERNYRLLKQKMTALVHSWPPPLVLSQLTYQWSFCSGEESAGSMQIFPFQLEKSRVGRISPLLLRHLNRLLLIQQIFVLCRAVSRSFRCIHRIAVRHQSVLGGKSFCSPPNLYVQYDHDESGRVERDDGGIALIDEMRDDLKQNRNRFFFVSLSSSPPLGSDLSDCGGVSHVLVV